MSLASKQAWIFQNEDTDPEHEIHEKARRSTARPAASDTERRCITPKEGPREKWADNAQGVSASQHYHNKNYILDTVILTMGAYRDVLSSLGEKELPVKN